MKNKDLLSVYFCVSKDFLMVITTLEVTQNAAQAWYQVPWYQGSGPKASEPWPGVLFRWQAALHTLVHKGT